MPTIRDIIEQAEERGFTRRLMAYGQMHDLDLMVEPTADLDGTFTAYCVDTGHRLRVNGWMHTFEVDEAA